MNIDVNKEGSSVTLKVEGRIDTVTAPELEKCLNENFEGAESLVFDFGSLSYISSAGLRVLLIAQKRANSEDCAMKIINVNDDINEIFEVTGFSSILTIE